MNLSFANFIDTFFGLKELHKANDHERFQYINTILFVALPSTLIFSLINYLHNFTGLAVAEIICSLILLFALVLSRTPNRLSLVEFLIIFYGFCITFALGYFGGIDGSGVLWIFAFPFMAFLLRGQKQGWLLSVSWMILLYAMLTTLETPHHYADEYIALMTGAMFFYILMAAAFNLARTQYQSLLNQQLQKSHEEAEFKSRFLAHVSHEIRTPVNAIYNMTDFALTASDSEKKQRYLNSLKTSTRQLLQLLNSVLDFEKLEKKAATLDNSLLNIKQELADIEHMMSSSMASKQIKSSFIIHEVVPGYVIGDNIKFRQIMINLINNAIKFTPEYGEITVHGRTLKVGKRHISIAFDITDTGIGMTPQQQNYVFESFRQANDSTTRQYGGTGLGLAIVKHLIELMQGRISLTSAVGEGSTFTVELKFSTDPERIKQLQRIDSENEQQATSAESSLAGLRVLLVEDDPVNLEISVTLLQQLAVTVVTAENGAAALDRLNEDNPVDVVLMDFNMPVMDGFEACTRIHQNPSTAHLPVIGLSANLSPADLQKAEDAGMLQTLGKPVIKQEIYSALKPYSRQTAPTSPIQKRYKTPQASMIGGIDFSGAVITDTPGLLERMLGLFLEHYQDFGPSELAALKQQDYEPARLAAHRLKGIFGNFGLEEELELASKTEIACQQQTENCTEQFEQLVKQVSKLTRQLKEALD